MSVSATGGTTPLTYADKYENLALTRDDDGLLVLRFHTAGGTAVFTGQPTKTSQRRLRRSRSTAEQGAGDHRHWRLFIDQIDGPSLGEIFKPAVSGRR